MSETAPADGAPGHEVAGPAIIEESFTTIVVHPGRKAEVDDSGEASLARSPGPD